MTDKPIVTKYEDGSRMWKHTFENFRVKVYVPTTDLRDDVINYGFAAPYLLVFEERETDDDTAKSIADSNGLADIASRFASSVVFVYPTCEGGWKNASIELYKELIANSKIHEYHEDGMAILNNRFTGKCDGYAIRGAIFRTFLFGCGDSADYIVKYLTNTVNGQGLWGPADIAPTACILEKLSGGCEDRGSDEADGLILPNPEFEIKRRDMPIVSVGNSQEINDYIMESVDDCYICAEADYEAIFEEFLRHYKRWGWVGTLEDEPDLDELGMTFETGIVNVKTSPDNNSEFKGTECHEVGYLAYYNKKIFEAKKIFYGKGASGKDGSGNFASGNKASGKNASGIFASGNETSRNEGKGLYVDDDPAGGKPVPLLLAFHGGGDSAMHIAFVAGWYKVAHDHDFLLVCIENHLNVTATETMQVLDALYERYNIDKSRVYATGFSMGGIKSWDMFQEYPDVFAGLAPMCATVDVGCNVFFKKTAKAINRDVRVPVFYVGGERSPLPELPFQGSKVAGRVAYALLVNGAKKADEYGKFAKEKFGIAIEEAWNLVDEAGAAGEIGAEDAVAGAAADKDTSIGKIPALPKNPIEDIDNSDWENKVWGINGDREEKFYDESRDGTLTLQYFDNDDGKCLNVLGSVDNQEHDCRHHTCEQAWLYLSQFAK